MSRARWGQLAAASGYAALICGAGAAALERPWPNTSSPAELSAFVADNRAAILGQSMLFVISAGIFMLFLGSLRGFLIRHEGGTGQVTTVGFAAGMIAYGLNVAGQAPQITVALGSPVALDPMALATLTELGYVMLAVANIPLVVMFSAIAVVSLRDRAFPPWLGWVAVAAAIAALLLTFTVVDPTGPLAPQGWLELPAVSSTDLLAGAGNDGDGQPNRPRRHRQRAARGSTRSGAPPVRPALSTAVNHRVWRSP